MKQQKMLYMESNLIEALNKTENASKLVSGLLTDYFFGGGGLDEEEMKLKIKELQQGIERDAEKVLLIKDKLATVKVKKDEIKVKFNKVPDYVLADFRQFPMMTEEALASRYKDMDVEQFEDVKKAYRGYFNK